MVLRVVEYLNCPEVLNADDSLYMLVTMRNWIPMTREILE